MLLFIEAAVFIFTIHFALLLYVGSSFLGQFYSDVTVGYIYVATALLTIGILAILPHLLRRFGQFRVTLTFLSILAIAALSLGLPFMPLAAAAIFVLLYALQNVLRVNFDIYTETYTRHGLTGRVRGLLLVIMNTAIAIAPFFAGMIVGTNNYRALFVVAALALVPVLIIALIKLRNTRDRKYHDGSLALIFRKVRRSRNIYSIFIASFLLELFYATMTVYTPLYLTQHMGFSWAQTGTIFTIMLLAFPLLQWPAGYLADKYWGEKEMLVAGFAVMGIATTAMAFLTSTNWIMWATILFATRVGAALAEAMTEIYFFKHVTARDSDIISFFRNARPFSFIAGPVIATLTLAVLPFNAIFVVVGLIMLYGIRYALAIKDTL